MPAYPCALVCSLYVLGCYCQELRKAASQQLRDAHMTQGEVERTLREEQRTAEKRQQELKVGCCTSMS